MQQSTFRGGGQFVLKDEDLLEAKMEAFMTKKLQGLNIGSSKAVTVEQVCELCSNAEHDTSSCPNLPMLRNYIGEQYPADVNQVVVTINFKGFANNNFSPQWRNHPNLSWRPQGGGNQGHHQGHCHVPQPALRPKLEIRYVTGSRMK